MIEIPKNFDVNIFAVLSEEFSAGLQKGSNIIGASELPFGMKKIVITKLLEEEGIKINTEQEDRREMEANIVPPLLEGENDDNAKMLSGKLFEDNISKPNVLSNILVQINEQLNLNSKEMKIAPQCSKLIEVEKGYFLRVTPDILTNFYIIEIKTTGIYAKKWDKELAPYQVAQLNLQMGTFNIDLGFILKVNTRWQQSSIKATSNEEYWTKLWNDYGYILPWRFDKQLYDKTIERLMVVIEHLKTKRYEDLSCPQFDWECYSCKERVRKKCGKEEYACTGAKCYKKLYDYPHLLTPNFLNLPMCETCFKKENPHSNYLLFKFKEKEKENE